VKACEGRTSFLKKEAKTFAYFGFGLSGCSEPSSQKFFGSLFQKRTTFFVTPPRVIWR
jgi:hypothetical protein